MLAKLRSPGVEFFFFEGGGGLRGGVTDPGPQGSMDLLGEAEEWGDSVVPMRGSAAGDRQRFRRGLGEPGVWLTGRRAGSH